MMIFFYLRLSDEGKDNLKKSIIMKLSNVIINYLTYFEDTLKWGHESHRTPWDVNSCW